jgi:hypothetical protein
MEILEQLRLLKQLFSYGLSGEIVIAIGLLIIFFYQRHKIESLETQIKSQKGILESAETFFHFFDLGKLKSYGEILAEKVGIEKDIEIKKMKENYDEIIRKYEDREEKTKFIFGEFLILLDAFYDAFFRLPSKFRNEVVYNMGEGIVKVNMKKAIVKLEEMEKEARIKALELVFKSTWWKRKEMEGDETE